MLINAVGVEKVGESEKCAEDVRMGPVFTGLFLCRMKSRSHKRRAERFENRGGRMAAEFGKVSNC